jgi:hypothetical protein
MSNSKKSLRRSIKSGQLAMRELVIDLNQATDAVSGPDQLMIESVTDLGAGQHLITLKDKAKAMYGKPLFLKGFSSRTADVAVQVLASDDSSITVQSHVAGVAADADITLCIGVHDWKFEYEA